MVNKSNVAKRITQAVAILFGLLGGHMVITILGATSQLAERKPE